MNVIGWCGILNGADPDYPGYLDGVAFHPYNSATDYQRGVYGLYGNCVNAISGSLKVKKPLWCTECFYIVNARKQQTQCYVNQGICGANEVQRHYLDGLLLGVKCSTSVAENTLSKRTSPTTGQVALSEMGTATNALSWLLKDMDSLEPLAPSRLMRAGIFTDAAKDKALGFVYDLRPAGSSWTPGPSDNVKIMDLFGNELKDKPKIAVCYEPHFVSGTTKDVRALFAKSKFVSNESARIFARNFRNEVHLDAINSTGAPCTAEIVFDEHGKFPNVQFVFKSESDDCPVNLGKIPSGAKLDDVKFKTVVSGEESGSGSLTLIAPSSCNDLTPSENEAKDLTLNLGSKMKIWSEPTALRMKANVKDSEIVAANGTALWEGDALEVFIDPAPFKRLDRDVIKTAAEALPAFQFAFAATPSSDGTTVVAFKRTDDKFTTNASCKSIRTNDGYMIDASIPWSELLDAGVGGDIIGLDVEIDHKDSKSFQKESLSGVKGKQSFNARLHYPLFKLPPSTKASLDGKSCVRNSDFSSGSYGDPDVWSINAQGKGATAKLVDEAGCGGGRALVFDVKGTAPEKGAIVATQMIAPPSWAKGAKVCALAKMEGVNSKEKELNTWAPQGFVLSLGQSDYSRLRRSQITGSSPWTIFQYYAEIPANSKDLPLSVGLRGNSTGKLTVSLLNVEFVR